MTSINRLPRAAVSFILLAAALFFIPVCASATGLDIAAGTVLDGALSGLSVDLGISSGAVLTTYDLIRSIVTGSPFGTLPDYTYNQPLSEILNQETIKIRKDSVVIDGVEYSDVWLPHDAANKFRVNAFDFITHYNILSESAGTYVSGVGYAAGVPMFSDGHGNVQSQTYIFSRQGVYPLSSELTFSCFINNNYFFTYDSKNSFVFKNNPYEQGLQTFLYYSGNQVMTRSAFAGSGNNYYSYLTADTGATYTPDAFDFTWVSGSISPDPLPQEQGLRLRVPSGYVSHIPSVVSPDLANYVTLINDLSNSLEQARLADEVESTAFEEYSDTPVPPVPSTGTIAEEPYTSLDGSLDGIQDSLDNIDTNIGTVDESLDDIQVYAQDASESLQSIDTNLSQSVADTAGIKGFIQQYLPGLHSLLSSISSAVSNIAGSVASADETFFGHVVDAIVAPFTPVFDIFKSGVGIWRYVVAWVGNISAPFSWIWNTLSQANGILVSPILASAAAAVVLAVYKRFGR